MSTRKFAPQQHFLNCFETGIVAVEVALAVLRRAELMISVVDQPRSQIPIESKLIELALCGIILKPLRY
jgi:hypothetical protein